MKNLNRVLSSWFHIAKRTTQLSRHHAFRPQVEILETRELLAHWVWVGGTGSWFGTQNWRDENGRLGTPGPRDTAQIMSGDCTVNLGEARISELQVGGLQNGRPTAPTLRIPAGQTLTITSQFGGSGEIAIGGSATVNVAGDLVAANVDMFGSSMMSVAGSVSSATDIELRGAGANRLIFTAASASISMPQLVINANAIVSVEADLVGFFGNVSNSGTFEVRSGGGAYISGNFVTTGNLTVLHNTVGCGLVVVAQNFVISGANALSFRGENNAVANANVEYTIAIWGGQLTNTIGRPRFNFAGVGLFRSVIDADGPLTYWWLTTAAGAGANAAPAGRNNAIAMLENTNYTFTLADFGFADLMDTEPDDFSFVVISSLPENGTLKLDGQDVEVNQSIDVDEIIANQLVFTPQTNSTGAPYDAFAFRVGDSGGTTDGSVDTDPLAKTMTMNVVDSNSVSHAPSGLSKTVSTWLSVPIVFALDDFGFADTSDSPANNPQSVKIATLPSSGLLTSSGIPVEVGSFVGVDQINEGKLLYWPPTDEAGDGIDSLTFQVRDDGGTFNNGEDTDLTARTITFDILDTAAQDTQYSTLKNETLTVLANDGLLRFAYAASGEDMTVTKVNGLTSNVGTGVSTGHGTLTVQSTGAFTFVPTTGFTGDVTFDYTVDDGYDESTATVTIHVVKVLAHDGGTSILHDHGGDAPGTVWADWLVSLADDADGDPDDLTIVAIDGLESNVGVETPTAMGGSVTVESDGSFTYNPRPNWKGDDWFAFTVSDEDDNTSTAFFLISVTNTPPVLEDQEYETGENETFEAPGTGWASGLLGGASDEDDDEIFIYAVQGETTNLGSATQTDQGGSVTVEEDGSWVYTPPLNWTGDDTFTVTAWDGCDFITVTITIHVG